MRNALGGVQSVLVLGGKSEIALAVVDELVDDTCKTVVLAARAPDELGDAAERVRAAGAETVETVAFDADDTASHSKVIGEVFERHRDLDVVIIAFGVLGDQTDFDEHPEHAADAVTTNYVGTVSAGLVCAARLRDQGHGTLVVLSSVAGERARRDNFVYGSSKAGADAFAQGLGDSLVGTGVNVVIVRPGFVRSQMTAGLPDGPFATTPEKVAADIVAGIRAEKAIVWSPPMLRWVFVGLRHLPRPVWRRVSRR